MAPSRKPSPDDFLGSLEARIMRALWKHGEQSVSEVLERLNARSRKQLAYNTVMSVMARLERKGVLDRRREGRAYIYWPPRDEQAFLRDQAEAAAGDLLNGFGDLAVAGLARRLGDHPELRAELEELLEQIDDEEE